MDCGLAHTGWSEWQLRRVVTQFSSEGFLCTLYTVEQQCPH